MVMMLSGAWAGDGWHLTGAHVIVIVRLEQHKGAVVRSTRCTWSCEMASFLGCYTIMKSNHWT